MKKPVTSVAVNNNEQPETNKDNEQGMGPNEDDDQAMAAEESIVDTSVSSNSSEPEGHENDNNSEQVQQQPPTPPPDKVIGLGSERNNQEELDEFDQLISSGPLQGKPMTTSTPKKPHTIRRPQPVRPQATNNDDKPRLNNTRVTPSPGAKNGPLFQNRVQETSSHGQPAAGTPPSQNEAQEHQPHPSNLQQQPGIINGTFPINCNIIAEKF